MSKHRAIPRAFKVETIPLDQHQVTFVSMEGDEWCGDQLIYPPDRLDRVHEVMNDADLTLVEYFPPELKDTAYSIPALGWLAKEIFAPSPHYIEIAKYGHKMGKRMGVADIANRPLFAVYGLFLINIVVEEYIGVNTVRSHQLDHILPTATDARRMLTAEAIMQEAERHPEGTHIAYIGAPAHVNRVARYLTHDQTVWDRARLALYRKLPGLDTCLRIYEPEGEEWRLAERHAITPRSLGSLTMAAASESTFR